MGLADILIVSVIVAVALGYVVIRIRKAVRDKACAGCSSSSCACRQAGDSDLTEIRPRSVSCPHCADSGPEAKN